MGLLHTVEDFLFRGYMVKAREAKKAADRKSEMSKCTVLAIDDDPAFLESMRWLLRDAGYTVLTSSSGSKGLDILRYASRDIRAVLLDFNMPKFNGDDTLQYVRQLSPKAKVIALTGLEPQSVPDSFRRGVDKFMQKPCSSGALVESLGELLAQESKEDEPWPACSASEA